MAASFFLSLREGLEAALIISILIGALIKLERINFQIYIWYGTGAALVLSGISGYLLYIFGASFEGRAEEIFEGFAMLLAAGILSWVIIWMQYQARTVNQKLEFDVENAIFKDSKFALFFLTFTAVIREGVELAIFLTAAALETDGSQIIIGALLGLGFAVIIAFLLHTSLIKLDLSRFFQVTSIILILFAAGLTAHGIHEFNETGLIPTLIDHVWDINHIIDENSPAGELFKTLFGYNGNPSLTEIVGYLTYFLVFGIMNMMINRKNTRSQMAIHEEDM